MSELDPRTGLPSAAASDDASGASAADRAHGAAPDNSSGGAAAGPAIRIRPAVEADADLIVGFNVALARESEGRVLDGATVARGVRNLLCDAGRGRYFLAECDGRVVGQLLVTSEWSDWRNGTFWWIQSVYVVPEHRGRGVYRALHRHVERTARAVGDVCGVRLYVEAANAAARAVYQRLGMRETRYLVYEHDWSGDA